MPQQIAIVDFGMGNLHSVRWTLHRIGVEASVTNDASDIERADKLILPGVGHFGQAMKNLKSGGLLDALHAAAIGRRVPVLGICLGMQLMARRSEEGGADGLGWIDGEVVRFRMSDTLRYKVPHVGWGRIAVKKDTPLLKDVTDEAEFYFVHSYFLEVKGPRDIIACESEYALQFPSVVQHDNLFGVQFHPEKSHRVGERLLKNFAEL